MKTYTVLFCVLLYSTEILGNFDRVRNFLENVVDNITRVRTPAERDSRWRDFAVLDFVGLVEQYDGYTAEEYEVQTVDGYILKLHRISGSPSSPKAEGKPPVFIAHGLFTSSDIAVVTGPKHSIAFLLADAGYDVWVGNFRGNAYSKRHIKYSSFGNNFDFWNFSMDEMGLIDLPLFVDTILEKTNKKKLTFIGYSMGSTVCYIFLSAKPEYNDKMNFVLNIAPVGIFTRPLSQLLTIFTMVEPVLKSFFVANRIFQLVPQSKLTHLLGKDICSRKEGVFVCETLLKLAARIDRVDPNLYPVLFSHVPAGTSLNTVDHYYQMMTSGKFRFYNYGVATNRAKYNADSPPEYNLSQITSPQGIVYAENDIYASFRDTKAFKSRLPNVVAFEEGPKTFNHLDFALHVDARDLYYKVLEVITPYASS